MKTVPRKDFWICNMNSICSLMKGIFPLNIMEDFPYTNTIPSSNDCLLIIFIGVLP